MLQANKQQMTMQHVYTMLVQSSVSHQRCNRAQQLKLHVIQYVNKLYVVNESKHTIITKLSRYLAAELLTTLLCTKPHVDCVTMQRKLIP